MEIIGEDVDREKKLTEIRNQMDKFKKISVPPHERGFTSSSLDGKSIGAPVSYDDGKLLYHQLLINNLRNKTIYFLSGFQSIFPDLIRE